MALELDVFAEVGSLDLRARLEVRSGECLALVGPSGAGKTTILRMIAGLSKPISGRIHCNGRDWFSSSTKTNLPPDGRSCGYVFQDYALFPHMRVRQNVAFGVGRANRRDDPVEPLMRRFGILSLGDRWPRELSGGEQQRVALARALARNPETLLLDEPLSALDAQTRGAARVELTAVLAELQVPTVLVTHDFGEASELGDRIAIVEGGRIVQLGSSADITDQPSSAFAEELAAQSTRPG